MKDGRVDLILLLVLRSWRHASAFVVGLRVVTTSVGILSLIMVLVVGSVGAPATVGAAATSRTRVGWWIWCPCKLVFVGAVRMVLVPKSKLTICALAFVTVPKRDALVLERPIPIRIARCASEFVRRCVIDEPRRRRTVEATKLWIGI